MKSLFYLFLPIAGVWLFSSCANLEQVETTDLDRESVFADSAYTAGFLSQIYVDVGYDVKPNRYTTNVFGVTKEHGGLQTACDEAAYKVVSDVTNDVMFATGTINSLNVLEDDVWKKAYTNIRRVNLFMKYVDGAPLLESTKIQYKAEARFLRAWYYAMMLRHYGGVPLLGDTIYEVEDDMKTKRDTYADCVKYIVDECELAAKDLPVVFSGMNNGRATAGACKGLISRIRLYEASKLFNGSDFGTSTNCPKELIGHPNYDKERWKAAVDAALDVIKLNRYAIYTRHVEADGYNPGRSEPGWGFYAIFHNNDFGKVSDGAYVTYSNGSYCEMIFECRPGEGNQREALFGPPTCGGNGNGGYIYHDLVEQFPMKDGKKIGYARSVWAMISLNTRKPADLLALHGGSIVDYVCDEPCPIEKPSRIKVTSMEPASSLNARYSDIDINGHVNSIRYIEHILDLFPIELYKESRIRRFEMAYVAESYYDDELTFYKDYVGDGTYDVEVRKNGNEVVCRSKVIFVGK